MTTLTDRLLELQIVRHGLIRGKGSKGSIRFKHSKEACATTAYSFNLDCFYGEYDERDAVADEFVLAINAIPDIAAEITRLTSEVERQQEAIEVAMETATMFDPESVKHAKIQMMTIAQTLSEHHDPQFRTDFQGLKDRLEDADALADAALAIVACGGGVASAKAFDALAAALTAFKEGN